MKGSKSLTLAILCQAELVGTFMETEIAKAVAPARTNLTQVLALLVLHERSHLQLQRMELAVAPSDIARELGMRRNRVHAQLKDATEKGWVQNHKGAYVLSDPGARLAAKLGRLLRATDEALSVVCSKQEQAALGHMATRLQAAAAAEALDGPRGREWLRWSLSFRKSPPTRRSLEALFRLDPRSSEKD